MLQTKPPTFSTKPYLIGSSSLALDELVEKIVAHYGSRLYAIYLFGSRARGDFHDESDVDIAVILNDEKIRCFFESEAIGNNTFKYLLETNLLPSVIFVTLNDWVAEEEPIIYFIKQEGIKLYG